MYASLLIVVLLQNSVTEGSPDHPTCKQFVENLQRGQENKRLSLVIVGLDAYERCLPCSVCIVFT